MPDPASTLYIYMCPLFSVEQHISLDSGSMLKAASSLVHLPFREAYKALQENDLTFIDTAEVGFQYSAGHLNLCLCPCEQECKHNYKPKIFVSVAVLYLEM